MGKLGKALKCVAGAAVAVAAAPVVLPAVASSAAGAAIIGAATTAGTAIAGTAAGTAVAGVTTAATGAVAAVGTAVAGTAAGSAIVTGVGAVGGALVAGAEVVGVTTTAAAALGAATVGAGVTYSGLTSLEGFSNNAEADEKINNAKIIYNGVNEKLEKAQTKTISKMESLNKIKVEIYANEIMESIRIIEKVRNLKQSQTTISELEFNFTPEEIEEVKQTSVEAMKIAKGSLDGIGTSVAMSSLATSLVTNFGVASTGTAISSLSGAAAQRATLAALGGGALKAGGAGMAGGQVMLGGIALVPTAIMMSHKYAQNSENRLTQATRYYSEIREEVGKIEATISWLENSVNVRIEEVHHTLLEFRRIYSQDILRKLKYINNRRARNGKIDINECTSDEQKVIVKSCAFIKSMKEIIKAPILTEDGVINEKTKDILDVYGDISKLYI